MKNVLADDAGTKPASLEFAANPRTKQPIAVTASNVHPIDTGKTVTADNTQLIAQNKPTIPLSNNFSHTLGKKVMTKTSRNTQSNQLNKGKRKGQDQNSGTLSEMVHPAKSVVQEQLTQPVVLDKTANAKVLNQFQQQPESQAHGKTVRLTANSKAPTTGQIASATFKPANKPIQSTTDQGQIKSEIILPAASESLLIADTQSEKGRDTGKQQESVSESPKIPETNKTAITSTFPSSWQNQQSGKEVTSQTLLGNNKTTVDSEQSAHLQQKVLTGQESPILIAEQATPSKVDTGQKDHRGKTEFFELPEKNSVPLDNLSVKAMAQKMSRPQVRSSALQPENSNNSLVDQNSNPNMEPGEQILVGGNIQPAITEPSLASTAFTNIAGNADSADSVGEQIQESIHSSFRTGNQQIVIRLNPPELGKVAIKFAEQGDNIAGLLQVDKPQTRDQIQQVLPEIIQNLQNSGIGIEKLEVVLTNQQEQQTSKDQSSTAGQDSWAEQQSSPNPESQGNNTIYSEWLTNIDNVPEYMEPQVQLTDNSINMLV
ncbi:MAG: flagellar hook-length control protein FliK [Planctomycetota bacterium]